MLYISAIPIGNLEDITLRVLRILKSCDYILAEDTRKAKILLSHYKIPKKVFKFEKFSEKKKETGILQDLEEGKEIVLLSDAGVPLICDPGENLIKACQKKRLKVTALPGACSVINALVLSGFNTEPFQFLGFLKRKDKEKKRQILKMLFFSGTSIIFESAKRILSFLKLIQQLDPQREIVIAREMTKLFEEIKRGTAEELLEYYTEMPLKGEIVLLTGERKNFLEAEKFPLEDLLQVLQEEFGLSKKEALKMAAKILKQKKSGLYKEHQQNLGR